MATKQARGTKRTCQSDECGARFYDLNRDPISCPICGSVYELASSPLALQAAADEKIANRRGKKPEFVAEKRKIDDPEAIVSEDALDNVEEEAEAVVADDETFLEEEEEEGGDLANVIGGPVVEGEEEV
ncbi:MAG: TIGR02300 family protein [Hyphomicrobium sp.]